MKVKTIAIMNYNLIPFSSSIFFPNWNIKIKDHNKRILNLFKTNLTKNLKKGFGFTKVDVYTVQISPCKLLAVTGI